MKKLNRYFCKLLACDKARISIFPGKMYLIIGFKKNTKDDTISFWTKNGKRIDFKYLDEKVVASGKNEKELIASAKHYKKLCGMAMMEFLKSGLTIEGGNQ